MKYSDLILNLIIGMLFAVLVYVLFITSTLAYVFFTVCFIVACITVGGFIRTLIFLFSRS